MLLLPRTGQLEDAVLGPQAAGEPGAVGVLVRDRITLVILRHQLPHEVLAELFEVDRSTVSQAVR
ncbi:transposase family protein, partial [Streptomyces sp. NPDC001020]